ncbi:unnamed protein product [Prunus brigantina]
MGLFYSGELTDAPSIVGYASMQDIFRSTSRTLTNRVCVYMWRNCNLMALNKANAGSHIFQSLGNTCPP